MAEGEPFLKQDSSQVEECAIFLLDPEGRITSWNRGAERIKGFTPEEATGQHLSTLYPSDSRSWVSSILSEAAQKGQSKSESWQVRNDGVRFWASSSLSALNDAAGQLHGFFAVVRDLTTELQANIALQQAKLKFDLLMSGVQEYAIFLMDPEGRVTDWNTAAERLLGYSQEEIIGQHFSIFWTAEEAEPGGVAERELRQAAAEGSANDDRWHVRKNDTHFWANGITSCLRDEQGNLRGYAKVLRDNTDRKRFEEELRAKAEALENADRRKDEFLAMLAHELRNPLAPIASAVTLLQATEQASEAAREAVNVAARQVGKMTWLINDLMDVSRITRGKVQLQRERVDLRECVQNAAQTMKPAIEEHNHRLMLSLPDDPLWLSADSTRLEQIFENLLNNAAKYTEAGGSISVTVERQDGHGLVHVKDTGMGIAPELLPHIFDLFTQADRALDRSEGGLGIGLTIVKNLVEFHDGAVEASTDGIGKGSQFTVRLPLLLVPQPNSIATASDPQSRSKRARILVVDDNVDAAKMMSLLLSALGHEVQTVYCGVSALEAVASCTPSLILLDIGLPGLDGYKIAQRLRGQAETKNIPLVAITGYGQPEDRQRSMESGFDFHLVKPVNIDEVQSIIESLSSVP